MEHQPSKYQSAIYDYIKNDTGNLVVTAVAGSGKTTTAINSLQFVDRAKKVLFLAFNKSIASALQARVPFGVKAATIHSIGFSVVKSIYPNATMDADKVYNAIQIVSKENRWTIPADERVGFMTRIQRIATLMRLTLASTLDECEEMCRRFGIENDNDEATYGVELYDFLLKDIATFDFTDMIFIPAINDFKSYGYDMIYVDEFQDCSLAQYRFLKKLLKKNGRFVVIGDKNQSIYGYLGSDPKLFDEALAEPNTIALPLSISYRCGKSIVEHAKKIVPHIQHRPDAHEGEVVINGSIKNIKDGDFVLCRINRPLVKLCLEFLKEGRKATIRGSDIGKSLVNFIKAYQSKTLFEMEEALNSKRIKLMNRLIKKFPDRDLDDIQEYQTFMEKMQTILILADESGSVVDIICKIERIFSDDTAHGIILSSVHKAKGLEAKNVFIVEPSLIPFKKKKLELWEIQQESNIDYVARTRAIDKLEYVRDWTSFKKT